MQKLKGKMQAQYKVICNVEVSFVSLLIITLILDK